MDLKGKRDVFLKCKIENVKRKREVLMQLLFFFLVNDKTFKRKLRRFAS